jgi:hypothetical protein
MITTKKAAPPTTKKGGRKACTTRKHEDTQDITILTFPNVRDLSWQDVLKQFRRQVKCHKEIDVLPFSLRVAVLKNGRWLGFASDIASIHVFSSKPDIEMVVNYCAEFFGVEPVCAYWEEVTCE